MRLRLREVGDETHATVARIDEVASALRLEPQTDAVRELSVVVETAAPGQVARFWSEVLGYEAHGEVLMDPLRRRPTMLLRQAEDRSGPQSWLHLDASRLGSPNAEAAANYGGTFTGGAYGVCTTDIDGNVVDIIPADRVSEDPAVSVWHGGFAAQAAWRAASAEDAALFALEAAEQADQAGLALAIDRRDALVVVDSGKDGWATQPGFDALAASVQASATRAGLSVATEGLGFVQAFLSAENADEIRSFWMQALDYLPDPRADVLDIVDPHGLEPVMVFQEIDEPMAGDARARFHLHLAVAAAAVHTEAEHITDPEGNVLELVPMPPCRLPLAE